ncbi:MAG: hypothetical protein AAGA55_13030 [Planctomycetota bacterium]
MSCCAPKHLNERLTLGVRPTASFVEPAPETGIITMRSSVRRDRPRWDTVVDGSPIDGVVHDATLRFRPLITRTDDTAWVSAYPDPVHDEEMGRSGTSPFVAAQEFIRALFESATMAVRSVNLGARTDHSRVYWSPSVIWKRTPIDRPRLGTVPGTHPADPAAAPVRLEHSP